MINEKLQSKLEMLFQLYKEGDASILEFEDKEIKLSLKENLHLSSVASIEPIAAKIEVEPVGKTHQPENQPSKKVESKSNLTSICSHMDASIYLSASPSDPPFVKIGSKVSSGDTLCLLEVMKMFTELKAPKGGVIRSIHAKNGDLISVGDLLFEIE